MVLIDLEFDDFSAMVRAREGRNVSDTELHRRFAKLDVEGERANAASVPPSPTKSFASSRGQRRPASQPALIGSRSAPGLRLNSLAPGDPGADYGFRSVPMSPPMPGMLDDGMAFPSSPGGMPGMPGMPLGPSQSMSMPTPSRSEQLASATRLSTATTGAPEPEFIPWPSYDPPGFASEVSSRPGSRPSTMQSRQARLIGEIPAQRKDIYGRNDPRELLADGRYDGYTNVVVDDGLKQQKKIGSSIPRYQSGLLPGGLPGNPVGGHRLSSSYLPQRPVTTGRKIGDDDKGSSRARGKFSSPSFRSRTPRFALTRNYSGTDTRNFHADDPFTGYAYKFQARSNYWKGHPDVEIHVKDEDRLGAQPRESFHGLEDSYRPGVVVRQPRKQHASFLSEYPRFERPKQLEPYHRVPGQRKRKEAMQAAGFSASKAF